ncbi:MAG: hypothetical protein A2W00_10475 [Candidatus Eisenbacteria bacterium RBG_16_71_46]|nr:MAG: hypothetical protein A2W00_10475 [Candidatus Eisenbacteria bacterium RBG_16_71_46]
MIAFLLLLSAAVATADPAPAGRDSLAAPAVRDSLAALTTADTAPAVRDSLAAPGPPPVPDPVYVLPEVRVERARRPSEARRRLPTASLTEIAAGVSGRAIEPLPELLATAAGVHVTQYGGLGAFSTVSLRGSPANQVAIYLDGTPLTSAAHGTVNLADLPATAIERIEVYRGLAPLAFGLAAPGGAINLVTAATPGLLEARVARGAFDTWEARATSGASRGPLAGWLHLGYQSSAGNFRFADDNGTPFNPADDSTSVRLNNRFDAATALAHLAWLPAPGLRVAARLDRFHKAQGVPGLGAVPARHPRLAIDRAIARLETERRQEGLAPRLRASGTLERERTRFRDREGELGLGRHDTADRFGAEEGRLEAGWPRLPLGLALEGAASLRAERAAPADAADGYADPPPSRRASRGAALGLQARPLGEWLVLHAARRWDRVEDRLNALGVAGSLQRSAVARELDTPQLGARLAGPLGLEVRANWTRASRVPDFLELFGNQGSVTGNVALHPERAENRDVGAGWSLAGAGFAAGVEWTHFESLSEDLILYVRNSQSSVKAQNVARARIRGEEFSLHVSTPVGLAVSGSFTAQSARDEGPVPAWHGKRLPQRPEREAYARLDWRRSRMRAGADLHWIGEDYLDRYNRQRVPGRGLVGASLSYAPLGEGVRLTLEGKNLGDSRATDVAGFPLPGRGVFVSLETRLGHDAHQPLEGDPRASR